MRVALAMMISTVSCLGCGIFNDENKGPRGLVDESHLVKMTQDSTTSRGGDTLQLEVYLRPANPNTPNDNYPVRWEIVRGGGSVSSASTLTNDNGHATILWTLGDSIVQQVRAVTDIPGPDTMVVYTAFIRRLVRVSGDSQTIHLTGSLAPFIVALDEADGSPVAGEAIRWQSFSPGITAGGIVMTDANGAAEITPSVGIPDSLQMAYVRAQVVARPGDAIDFTILSPYRLRVVSGDSQAGAPGARLAQPVMLEWVDMTTGEPGPPARFVWRVSSGNGVLDADTTVWSSGSTGMSNGWTLGSGTGRQSLYISRLGGDINGQKFVFATAVTGNAAGCGGVGLLHEGDGTYIPTSETWTAAASPHIVRGLVRYDGNATLTIQAGATVCLENAAGIYLTRDLQAIGTPANPIRFLAADTASPWASITLGGPATAPLSQISNARFEHAFTAITAASPVRIDSTIIRQSRNIAIIITNSASSNRVYRTTIDTTRGTNPAVLINAPGTLFEGTVRGASSTAFMVNANDVRLQNCEISGNSSFGVLVAGYSGAVVTGCNLLWNAGFAVAASAGAAVDARSNWWGAASGPPATGANSVSAGVDASTPLATPAPIGYRPTW